MKNILLIILSLLIIGGCEDLEDTYSHYAGDGAIRYVGVCTNISITSGWKRLIVKWDNNPDPRIEKIKVTWETENIRDSLFLASNETECSIPNLEEGNYEIRVYGVDKEGKLSLSTPLFGRPYTSNHETILSFTRLIAKHYFVKDRLALFFSTWSANVESAELNYYVGENLNTLKLNSDLIAQKYYLLPDHINLDKPVVLKRQGRIEGCEDLIVFDDYTLLKDKLYTTDFKQFVKMKYGISEITDTFVNNQTELEIDYSITSFEDILNFPNLKKLILGKNRFLKVDYLNEEISSNASDSKLYEKEASLFALNVANEVYGLTVERYNQHFLPKETLSYMKEMGNPTVPIITCLDRKDWEITCIPEDEGNYNSYLENLFDDNLSNRWQPESQSTARSHEITVDMKGIKTVSGVKIVQNDFNPKDDKISEELLPGIIKIKISTDKIFWWDATYVEENTIGATAGETTIINFQTPQDIRYLQFIINDQSFGKNFAVTLAEISIF